MSHGNQSYLRFSLEESVWFQKGQEVEELISISLDPNITIQESDQYITIKGSLELSGEYNREEVELEENTDLFNNPRSIQSVEARGEGLNVFSHHFPVEVTIPKNRIQDLNEIDVTVETFDYAFPERSCLRLSADLMITGLYGEQQHELYHEEEEMEYEVSYREIEDIEANAYNGNTPFAKPSYEEEEVDDVYQPFKVEARREPELESEPEVETQQTTREELVEIELFNKNEQEGEMSQEEVVEEVPAEIVEEIEEEEQEEEPKIEDYPEITFGKRSEEPTPSLVAEEVEEVVEEEVIEEVMEEVEEESSSSSSSSPEPQAKKGSKWKGKKSLTLSEFFARREEEEHTKLKMCIVQQGENLENISERYAVPVSQIQRVNEMELNQDIYEGQVLYIPVPQTSK